jgi:hypothetical protein
MFALVFLCRSKNEGALKPNSVLWIGQREIVEDSVIEVFQGKGRGQMELDFGFEFTLSASDFQEEIL